MLDSLLGAQLGTTTKFVIAFLLVLGLIGITALILRRFGGSRMPSSGGGRNRQPRLSVLDSAVVDAKRRLVLIRRDNSEHLLLIGGPTDVVVETNINRTGTQPASVTDRRPQLRPVQAAESDPFEPSLVPETDYEEDAHSAPEAAPAPAPRMRGRDPRPQPEPEMAPRSRERQPAPRPEARQEPRHEQRNEPRHEPAPRQEYQEPAYAPPPARPEPAAFSPPPPLPPRAPAPAPQPSAPPPVAVTPEQPDEDRISEMAQRLEAALRKPAPAPAPKAPEPRVNTPAPQPRQAPPMPQTRPMPAAAKQDAPNPFDSLEAEMASLFGQDKKQ